MKVQKLQTRINYQFAPFFKCIIMNVVQLIFETQYACTIHKNFGQKNSHTNRTLSRVLSQFLQKRQVVRFKKHVVSSRGQ